MHKACRSSPVWSFANASAEQTPRCQTGKLGSDFSADKVCHYIKEILKQVGLGKNSGLVNVKAGLSLKIRV